MLSDYINLQSAFANDNPFYPNYRVVVDSPDNIPAVKQQLEQIDGVYRVNAPLDLSNIFVSLQRTISYACYVVVGVLAIVSIVVINQHHQNHGLQPPQGDRHHEAGGRHQRFHRFPFFVEGVTSGLIAAAIASGVVCGAYYALCRWYAENPSTLSQMFGGQLVPRTDVWYYIVGGFALLGFVLCGIGTATSIRKHLNV